MRKPRHHQAGFTWTEVLVFIVIVGVFLYLSVPTVSSGPRGGAITQTLSNMKQLHLATQQMALDGVTTGDSKLGWPGDIGSSFTNWSAALVPSYLGTNDFCKLLSAPYRKLSTDSLPAKMSDTAVLVYAVRSDSADSAVVFSTANFTNTPAGGTFNFDVKLYRKEQPHGDKAFVVFHKAGDGQVLSATNAGYTKAVGSFEPLCR